MVRTLGGIGSSRTVISIAMPNIPSLPTKSPTRSGPQGSPCGEPSRDDRAVGKHDLELDDVVGGDAVLEAVRPAGVLRDVAAHGARRLARGIGHVVEAVRRDRLGEPRVDHAGLDHGAPAHRVHPEDAVHPGERDEHRVGIGHRAAREAGAGAARDERHAGEVQQPDDLAHLRRGSPASRRRRDSDSRVGRPSMV